MPDEIFIRTLEGKTTVYYTFPSMTVRELKQKIQNKTGYLIAQQDLFFQGKLLSDDLTMEICDIRSEAIVNFRPKITGGDPGFWFRFLDISKVIENELATTAPEYRTIIPGLNFLLECSSCKEYVAIQIGYNKNENDFFEIGNIINFLKCSNSKCKAKISSEGFKNFVFSKSVWKFECKFKDEKGPISGLNFNLDDKKYITLKIGRAHV